MLGAGRTRADQAVDPAVGIERCVELGEAIREGSPLALLHVRDPEACDAVAVRTRGAFAIDADGTCHQGRRRVVLESILG